MRLASTALCLLFSSLAAAASPDPGNALWQYIHPGAKAVVGIDWVTVQNSAVGRWVERRWLTEESMPGIEFLPSVQEVLLSSPGLGAGDSGDPPVLIAARGNFDLARVRQALLQHGRKPQPFGDVTIFRAAKPGSSDPSFALVSSQIVLIGDTRSLFSTIERARIEDRQTDPEALIGRAQLLSKRYDCWAVLTEPGAMRNFLFASLVSGRLSKDSESFEAGISVRDGLTMDVVFRQRTETGARLLEASLNRGIHLAASAGPEGSGGWAALMGKLHIVADHLNVQLSLRMTPQEVETAFNAGEPRVTVTVAKATPPERRVVRIEGLEDGVREIVLK